MKGPYPFFLEERLIMDSPTLFPEQREAKVGMEKPAISLYEVCQQLLDGRAARGKRSELAALLVVLVVAQLAGRQSLLGASEWMRGSARALVPTRAPALETHALCAHVPLGAGASGQPAGACPVRGVVGAHRGAKPLRRGAQPPGLAGERAQRPPGHRGQSAPGHGQTDLPGRRTAEAGLAWG
jgi:hypothetical protein